jgi:hypothetical protein
VKRFCAIRSCRSRRFSVESSKEIVISRITLQLIVKTLVMWLAVNPVVFAAAPKASPASVPDKVRVLGVGHGASVWMIDGSHMTGKITSIDAGSFTLDRGHKHGTATLAFADVSKVQKSGLTTGDKISIGVLGVMVTGGVVVVLAVKSEGTGSNTNLCPASCTGLNRPAVLPGR